MSRKETFSIDPHSSKQEQIMTAFMTEGLQEMWVPCGTKFGKTLGGASAISAGSWIKSQGLFRWVAPIYTQSKIGKRYCEKLLPDDYYKARNDEPPTIRIHHTGANIEFWHGKNPESLEGEGVTGGLRSGRVREDEPIRLRLRVHYDHPDPGTNRGDVHSEGEKPLL